MTGLTSVTFRQLTVEQIITLVKKAGLDGIEWGGDVHVPAGNEALAKEVKEKTEKAGLKVLSYGSYFYAGEDDSEMSGFKGVLESAIALGVSTIRVWVGKQASDVASAEYRQTVVEQLQKACIMAEKHGIKIATEHHRKTLTDEIESCKKLFAEVNRPNLYAYWQPNPDISFEQQLLEIDELKDTIITYHVFALAKGNIRLPLQDYVEKWQVYNAKIPTQSINHILEFVKDNSEEQFLDDAKTLVSLLK